MRDRAPKIAPHSRRNRILIALIIPFGLIALAASVRQSAAPLLLYNASPSVHIGYYWVSPPVDLKRGDLVLTETPVNVRQLAHDRRYLPKTVPMIKHIAALSGDAVCASGDQVSVNHSLQVRRRPNDQRGRRLPSWNGCRHLLAGEVFLLNPDTPLSFDGRYFGVTRTAQIIGKVRPL